MNTCLFVLFRHVGIVRSTASTREVIQCSGISDAHETELPPIERMQ